MSVRSIQARIQCDSKTLEHLWRTHRVFNERLPGIISVLFKMRRGECRTGRNQSDLYQRMARFILASSSKNAAYLLNSVSIKGWIPNTAKKQKVRLADPGGVMQELSGSDWADDAARLSARGVLLYDKQKVLGDLPGTLGQMLCRESVAVISGHDELVARWAKEHDDWLKKKADWQSKDENKKYLALRPRFEDFEKRAGGKAGKRRARWHLYLAWLRANPDLAAWRGEAQGVTEISPAAKERIRRAKPWRKRSVEAEEFWKANPELQALDKLHGYYEREFIRRRKTKKNPDGFYHRPTFTLPHATRHPRWFVFNAPQTKPNGYRNLNLPEKEGALGSLELLLLVGDKGAEGKYPSKWVPVVFRGDPRLCHFRKAKKQRTLNRGKHKGETKEADAYEFYDVHLAEWRKAEISGVKLIFRIRLDGTPQAAYLYFTCTAKDLPLTPKAKAIQWTETGEVTRTGKKRKRKTVPEGLVTCAVDLGIRNLGFATLAVHEAGHVAIKRSRNLWVGWQEADAAEGQHWRRGPDLAHIAGHKREIRRLRSLRGKPVRGELSHVELQTHIDHMGEDRFKRAARAIINFARNTQAASDRHGEVYPRADVLILENMDGLIPDAEKEHGINRALVAWNRGQLTKRIEEMAKDVGLRIIWVSPFGTSQVCSRCGSLGRRYGIGRDQKGARPEIQFGFVEKLFACPNCGYRANADHNASVNLHRRFVVDDKAVAAFATFKRGSQHEQHKVVADIEDTLRARLRLTHRLDGPVPF